jgi:carboxylesterase type B
MVGDRWFDLPSVKAINYHAKKAKVYFYHFQFQGKYAAVEFLNKIAQKQGLPVLPAGTCDKVWQFLDW